jgi:hypothetical protein
MRAIREIFEEWCIEQYGEKGSNSPFTKTLKEKMFFAFKAGWEKSATEFCEGTKK